MFLPSDVWIGVFNLSRVGRDCLGKWLGAQGGRLTILTGFSLSDHVSVLLLVESVRWSDQSPWIL